MNLNTKTVSIVTRTKNEEQHLKVFFQAISKQSISPLEIIVVDNDSNDSSKEICEAWGAKVIETDDYLPGKALNLGFSNTTADYIAIISSHCIPASRDWLKNLCMSLEEDLIAGAYGRQLPTKKSKPNDVRDLLTTFPNESRIQLTDPFFHNANSVVRRQIWERYPFDNEVTNIEDRVWAKLILEKGYQLAYNPEAIVFHEHGINHDGDKERAYKISKVLAEQKLYPINQIENWFNEQS